MKKKLTAAFFRAVACLRPSSLPNCMCCSLPFSVPVRKIFQICYQWCAALAGSDGFCLLLRTFLLQTSWVWSTSFYSWLLSAWIPDIQRGSFSGKIRDLYKKRARRFVKTGQCWLELVRSPIAWGAVGDVFSKTALLPWNQRQWLG